MTEQRIYTSRISGLPLLEGDGAPIGKVEDVVLLPAAGEQPPRAVGLVATVQRRRIFVSIGRISGVDSAGVRLRGSTVDFRRFDLRPEEILASGLINRMVEGRSVLDVALSDSPERSGEWPVVGVALGSRRSMRRRAVVEGGWEEAAPLFRGGPGAAQLATLRNMHPTDLANEVQTMTPARRRLLTQALADDELADVLEEMSEQDQVRLLSDMDIDRVADVVEEMEPDDAVDLLAEMPGERRDALLGAMSPEDAASLRRLLRYDATTAGGLMTPQPVILTPESSVGEALARIRDHELYPAVAAQVFVCEAPTTPPTGRYLGTVGFQRLLREAPSVPVGECVQDAAFVRADMPEDQVAGQLAAYNLVGVAVCDDADRLVGAVTVDDVVDRILPTGWRLRRG